jgi:two-component system NtrC family sensor kinase
MKIRLIFSIILFYCNLLCLAQPDKTWIVGHDFKSAKVLGHAEVATVGIGDSSIHRLLHNTYAAKFAPAAVQIFSPRSMDSAYWIRFSIRNQSPGDVWLFSPYSGFHEYNVYQVSGDSIVNGFINGALQLFENRPVRINVSVFPLKIPPATEQQVYIYIRYAYAPTYNLYLAEPVVLARYLHRADLISGAYLGLFLLILFYNLVIYFYLRDRSNLIYSAWITVNALAVFAYHGLTFEFLWPHMPWLNTYVDVFTSTAVLLQIALNFSLFQLRATSRFFTRTSYIVGFLAFLCIFSHLAGRADAVYPVSDAGTIILINGINTLALSVFMVRRGARYAFYYLLGNLLFFLSMVLVILSSFGVVKMNIVSEMTMIYFGSAVEILFFALTLVSKVRTLKADREKSERENFQLLREREQMVRKQNETLEKLVGERTAALSESLKELKETQSQLVQREKMASLGELTAGIAHEIQNPLNFVSNFSEVNAELIEEMKQELQCGHVEQANDVADDIKDNNEKIKHHGRRADAIIKGMLEHSRSTGEGKKELTNINALVEQYLRLAHQGFRAKDKSFLAAIHTDYDNRIGDVSIAPHEIGRVLLNICNNAFYAVTQKKNLLNGAYEPAVSVSTKKLDGKIQICIRDNGIGISQKILDKIFQPFFTTKPTGQGTGLGLSLSYDIITKGHNGELKIKTEEGQYAEFIINLPA